jgi:DNA mismatch repair protein MutS2
VDPQSREVLEFEKVAAMLAANASSYYGRRRAGELYPFEDAASLEAELRFVQELKDIASAHGRPFQLDLPDLSETLQRCRVQGSLLEPEALTNVAGALSCVERVSSFVTRVGEEYPELSARTDRLFPLPALRQSIDRCVDPGTSTLGDGCSKHLREVRREKERVRSQTLGALEKILSSRQARPEDFITIRNDRYVIPVDSHRRSAVRGIVHDTSSSGATLFVEPMEVVEFNNRLHALHAMEKEEENRILGELTARVAEEVDRISEDVEILGEVDLGWAKAALSAEFSCCVPLISKRGRVRLLSARHPLLVSSLGNASVVPLDLEMGQGCRTLLISGPNMGGKTVALKTVGLLSLMMTCGLHIPAGDGSEVPLFDKVYADIGDQQSIEQSLSTFAAHIKQLARFLEEAGEDSLVLLDEIGAGTDPHEGGAMARAVLNFLTQRSVFCVATTHLGTLKPYVAEADGMENASMEFDSDTMKPRFVLQRGSPGRSMTLEMAGQLGLPQEIVGEAKRHLSDDELKLDSLLSDAERARERARRFEVDAEEARRGAQALREDLDGRLQQLRAKRLELEREAKDRCRQMVGQARREIETLLDEARKSSSSHPIREALRRTDAMEDRWIEKPDSGRPVAKSLEPGAKVWVNSLGVAATVKKLLTGGKALVERKGVRVEVPVTELREIEDESPEKSLGKGYSAPVSEESAAETIVSGLAGDEAVAVVEGQIDSAVLQGLTELKIIHGKGKGILRERIARLLNGHVAVSSSEVT